MAAKRILARANTMFVFESRHQLFLESRKAKRAMTLTALFLQSGVDSATNHYASRCRARPDDGLEPPKRSVRMPWERMFDICCTNDTKQVLAAVKLLRKHRPRILRARRSSRQGWEFKTDPLTDDGIWLRVPAMLQEAVRCGNLTRMEALVLARIASFVWDDKTCWMSDKAFVKEFGFCRHRLRFLLASLAWKGWIRSTVTSHDKARKILTDRGHASGFTRRGARTTRLLDVARDDLIGCHNRRWSDELDEEPFDD